MHAQNKHIIPIHANMFEPKLISNPEKDPNNNTPDK
jgi:hypothetical protein